MTDKPDITLREHLRRAGQSRSPRKLATLAKTREKAFAKAREQGRSPAQLAALAKAREKRWPKEKLPSIDEMSGLLDSPTGELSLKEYLERIRE